MNKNYKNMTNHYKLLRYFIKAISILNMIFLIYPLAYGAVITVGLTGNYQKIQDAINTSNDGDEIIVSQGKYIENIKFNGKNIILRSSDPTDTNTVAMTIIDGNQTGLVVTFSGTELTTCVLSGFTITNGKASEGGGIYGKDSKATIQNNTIAVNSSSFSNTYPGDGGGLSHCDGTIQNNTITGNFAYYGGGLFACDGIIQNNIITENIAYFDGGGLASCDGTIQNNTITENSAEDYGGGLYFCDAIIQNNIITGNSASSGYGGGLYFCDGTIQNNTITGNSAVDGGGLYFCDGTIQNNTITENSASYAGGGLCGCDGTIQNNTITGNSASNDGGGLCGCYGTIQNNTIIGNSASNDGGGLHNCDGTIQNNIITGNSALGGGGLYRCDGTIQNNTITENDASYGGGLCDCYGFIINCIIWDNSATNGPQIYNSTKPFYSCIQNWDGSGRGNILDNPGFVDPTNKDFHLQPDSPCIDKGNTYYLIGEVYKDMDGECRISGSSVDIGADEYGSSADNDGDLLSDNDETTRSCNISNQDTDGDGLIDGAEVLRGTNPLIKDLPSGILIQSNYPTIQQGIFMAFPGENVAISSGIYNENLFLCGKNIVLQSTNPSDVNTRNNTIIDGNKLNSVIRLKGMEDENCIIQGLTIRNGYTSIVLSGGGGIYGRNSNATIQNNIITGNYASGTLNGGGGLFQCNGIIQNNTITGNYASGNLSVGGGLCGCGGTIQNNTITGNYAASSGGGLDGCGGTIQNNIITGNSTDNNGGGLSHCNGTIQNNTITENYAVSSGGGIYWCKGIIRNCIIWGNTKDQLFSSSIPSYSCIQGWSGSGIGNINSDPKFIDPTTNNYHLKSSSPCIDAGCLIEGLTQDIEGNPRPYNGTIKPRGDGSDYDIGAYEYNICTLNYQDINDYILGRTSPPPEIIQQMDINNDGKVDIADIVYFMLYKK